MWQIVIVTFVIVFLLIISQSPTLRHKIRIFIGDESSSYYNRYIELESQGEILSHSITEINGEFIGYSLNRKQLEKLPKSMKVKNNANSQMVNCSQCHKND